MCNLFFEYEYWADVMSSYTINKTFCDLVNKSYPDNKSTKYFIYNKVKVIQSIHGRCYPDKMKEWNL